MSVSISIKVITSECSECFSYLKDRGILGGLRWWQCQGCALWFHRAPDAEEVNRDWAPSEADKAHAQTRLDKLNREQEVNSDD